MAEIGVRRLAHGLGAEVAGVDITRPLDDATVAAINDAWLEHHVLLFRGFDLTPGQQVAFSRRFGELDQNQGLPFYRDPEHPEIFVITTHKVGNKPSETRHTGRQWHSDLSNTVRPAKGTLLHCREMPAVGGDTMWTNMAMAYDRLSKPLRDFLDGLWAVHDLRLVADVGKRDPQQVAELYRLNPPVAQPVVRVHSETGRKALFVSERTGQFVGMTEKESRPLLRFLVEHATQPEFCYRHRWQVHDLMMWDNRCTMHIALLDYDIDEPRHMLRTTINGDVTGHVWRGDDEVRAAAE